MELLGLFDDYLASRPDLRPKTVTGCRYCLRRFARPYPMLADLTYANLSAYVQDCLASGKRVRAYRDAMALRLFSRWLVEAGMLPTDPLAEFRLPPSPKPTTWHGWSPRGWRP